MTVLHPSYFHSRCYHHKEMIEEYTGQSYVDLCTPPFPCRIPDIVERLCISLARQDTSERGYRYRDWGHRYL